MSGPGSGGPRSAERTSGEEVTHYVRRLLLVISLGVVLMAGAAIWAYSTYGRKLDSAAPLPSGTPPMASDSSAGPP